VFSSTGQIRWYIGLDSGKDTTMKSGRIGRVVKILTTLQSAKGYDVTELAKMFGTSRRTIFRDLKELQAIGVPYHYDSKAGNYSIDPKFFLPPLDLNLQEALSLLLLIHKAGTQIQLPFGNSALLAGLKIENNLPAKIRQYCSTTLKNISASVSPQASMKQFDLTFAQLQKAIAKKRKVSLKYYSLFERRLIELELCPYHLLYNRRAWYVLGQSSMHNSIRTFKLSRIKNLETLDKCFVDEGDFDLFDYFGRAWSMIPEGRIYNIKLRFLPKVAQNVTEVLWHATQQVEHNADGSAIVEYRVDGLGEILWWILGYGDQVQVLAPKALREKVLQTAQSIIKLNQNL